MVLNWTIEAINDLIACIILISIAFFILKNPTSSKIRTLIFLQVIYLCGALYFLFDGLSYLMVNYNTNLAFSLSYIENIFLIPINIFLILTISYTLKESYSIGGTILFGLLGIVLCYTGLLPGAMTILLENGYYKVEWVGFYNIISSILATSFLLSIFLWNAIITWKAPISIKREAFIFLFGAVMVAPISLIFYFIQFFIPIFILASDLAIIGGLFLMAVMLNREPRLLFVIPFIPYRIMIQDHTGQPLFDHTWTRSRFNEEGFENLSHTLHNNFEAEFLPKGPINIHLKEGVLIICNLDHILVGLKVSKSSKYLLDLIEKFSIAFEFEFKKYFGDTGKKTLELEKIYELLEKYFSIFPRRIVRNENRPIFFNKFHLKIPQELNEKLLQVMSADELEVLKCDIQRSSMSVTTEFLALFEQLEKELYEEEKDRTESNE